MARQTRVGFEIVIEAFLAGVLDIRVASKKELKDQIMAAIDDINLNPVIHSWTYKLDAA